MLIYCKDSRKIHITAHMSNYSVIFRSRCNKIYIIYIHFIVAYFYLVQHICHDLHNANHECHPVHAMLYYRIVIIDIKQSISKKKINIIK
jgi:hypothetical protein